MSDLLDISKANMNVVNTLLSNDTGDELTINITAYHLQQAAELYIKHNLEVSGVRYPKTHDIRFLLDLDITLPHRAELLQYADTLTSWESKTRYVKNYTSSRNLVLEVNRVLRSIILDEDSDLSKLFTGLSEEKKEKLRELNSVVYDACVDGKFKEVEMLLKYYIMQL